jgi:acetylornithine/N-succinyldiaminopimelate aminotransferase
MNNADSSYDHQKYNKRLMGNIVRMPLVAGVASGATFQETESGRSLLDFWGDEGVASMGYNTPEFTNAMKEFLNSGIPHRLPDVYPHELRWKAAEIICTRTGMDRLFFSNSGTEANEAAIKLARKYWWDQEVEQAGEHGFPGFGPAWPSHKNCARRHKIFTLEGNFHGRTGYSLAASDYRVSPYHRVGFGQSAPGFGVIDADLDEVALDGQDVPKGPPDWSKVAAIIMAPVLGNNLVKTYPQEWWDKLEAARKQHGFLLIYDDVQAGNGRAGHYATWQKYNVKPDIMTLSKGIAMGMPMSVTLASEEVAKSFTPGVHFNTFGGTLLCCHLAIKLYQWLDENLDKVRAKGEFIRQTFEDLPWVAHYDGSGMLNAFQPDFDLYGYDGYEFIARSRQLGLALVTHRQHGMIRFTPPLNVSSEDLDRAFEILDETHRQLAAEHQGATT